MKCSTGLGDSARYLLEASREAVCGSPFPIGHLSFSDRKTGRSWQSSRISKSESGTSSLFRYFAGSPAIERKSSIAGDDLYCIRVSPTRRPSGARDPREA